MFYRLHTDGTRQHADLRGLFAGPTRTPCWLIGGGPSLSALPTDEIAASSAPKFAVNLAGHGLLRPDFWTSYDPTARFHRSIYLDPSVTKFVHRGRAMDLVPETTFKVCDCPATFFFNRDPHRGFHNFPDQPCGLREDADSIAQCEEPASAICDWQDSLIQAIEIACHLGFRTLYLAGCEMVIRPTQQQIDLAHANGVDYIDREPLRGFFDRCRKSGLTDEQLQADAPTSQYHFEEAKPLAAAIQTDFHYFRVAQYLRLSRRAMSLAGLELISVTPGSRLNDYFDYRPADEGLTEISNQYGDPRRESTQGRYTEPSLRQPDGLAPMCDFPPHNWPKGRPAAQVQPDQEAPKLRSSTSSRRRLRRAIEDLPEIAVPLPDH